MEALGLTESGVDKLTRAPTTYLDLVPTLQQGKRSACLDLQAWHESSSVCWYYPLRLRKGFIRAVTMSYDDLIQYGSEKAVKEAGRLREEGKEYVVQDGDIMEFRFNV